MSVQLGAPASEIAAAPGGTIAAEPSAWEALPASIGRERLAVELASLSLLEAETDSSACSWRTRCSPYSEILKSYSGRKRNRWEVECRPRAAAGVVAATGM